MEKSGVEQVRTLLTVRSKGESGACLTLRIENLPSYSHVVADENHKGNEGEDDLEIHGDDPLKQRGSRHTFHWDN